MSSELEQVVARELSLLDPETRRRPDRVERLLHPEFREFGASGRAWDRPAIVAALAADPGEPPVAGDVRAMRVAEGVVLVTYEAGRSLRSSLWVEGGDGWRLLFHQGTPT